MLFLLSLISMAHAQSLDSLVAQALSDNPSLESLRARERAMQQRAEVVGTWTDPMLAIEYSNTPVNNFGLTAHPMSGVQFKAQQKLRPPGWSRHQREAGEQNAAAAGYALHEAELQLTATLRSTWWMLVRSRQLERVTQSHLDRTKELLQAAESRYATGTVGQHAILRLQVLEDQLTDELEDFQRADTELSAALNLALGTSEATSFDTPETIEPVAAPPASDWRSLAKDRPLLQQIGAQRDAARASAAFAKTDGLPDLDVWVGYRLRLIQTASDPGTDFLSLGVSAPIPVASGRKAKGLRAGWLEEESAADARLASTLDTVDAQMRTILARWDRAFSKASTYATTLLPGAQNTLTAAEADFAVGRADFASLFEAEITLLNLERARIVAAIETHTQQVRATSVLGTPPGAE